MKASALFVKRMFWVLAVVLVGFIVLFGLVGCGDSSGSGGDAGKPGVEGPSGAGDAPSPPAGGQVGGYADLAALPPKTLAEADAFVESMGYDLSAFYERPTEEDFENLPTVEGVNRELLYKGYDLFGDEIGDCVNSYDEVYKIKYDYRVTVSLMWNKASQDSWKCARIIVDAGSPLRAFTVLRSTNAENNWPQLAKIDDMPNRYVDELPTFNFVKEMPELLVWTQFYGGVAD
jgi:hypothetical protein